MLHNPNRAEKAGYAAGYKAHAIGWDGFNAEAILDDHHEIGKVASASEAKPIYSASAGKEIIANKTPLADINPKHVVGVAANPYGHNIKGKKSSAEWGKGFSWAIKHAKGHSLSAEKAHSLAMDDETSHGSTATFSAGAKHGFLFHAVHVAPKQIAQSVNVEDLKPGDKITGQHFGGKEVTVHHVDHYPPTPSFNHDSYAVISNEMHENPSSISPLTLKKGAQFVKTGEDLEAKAKTEKMDAHQIPHYQKGVADANEHIKNNDLASHTLHAFKNQHLAIAYNASSASEEKAYHLGAAYSYGVHAHQQAEKEALPPEPTMEEKQAAWKAKAAKLQQEGYEEAKGHLEAGTKTPKDVLQESYPDVHNPFSNAIPDKYSSAEQEAKAKGFKQAHDEHVAEHAEPEPEAETTPPSELAVHAHKQTVGATNAGDKFKGGYKVLSIEHKNSSYGSHLKIEGPEGVVTEHDAGAKHTMTNVIKGHEQQLAKAEAHQTGSDLSQAVFNLTKARLNNGIRTPEDVKEEIDAHKKAIEWAKTKGYKHTWHSAALAGKDMALQDHTPLGIPEPTNEPHPHAPQFTPIKDLKKGDQVYWYGHTAKVVEEHSPETGKVGLQTPGIDNGEPFHAPVSADKAGITLMHKLPTSSPIVNPQEPTPQTKLEDATVNASIAKPVVPPVGHIEAGAATPAKPTGALPKHESELDGMHKVPVGGMFSNGEKAPGLGYQGGQWYEHNNGDAFLVKGAQSPEHAENEVAASLLYKQAGIKTPDAGLITMHDGSKRVVSKFMPGLTPLGPTHPGDEVSKNITPTALDSRHVRAMAPTPSWAITTSSDAPMAPQAATCSRTRTATSSASTSLAQGASVALVRTRGSLYGASETGPATPTRRTPM